MLCWRRCSPPCTDKLGEHSRGDVHLNTNVRGRNVETSQPDSPRQNVRSLLSCDMELLGLGLVHPDLTMLHVSAIMKYQFLPKGIGSTP